MDVDEHQLRNPIAGGECDGLSPIGVEQEHRELAAVTRVDQAGGVDDRDPVARSEPRTREHQACRAARDLDRDPGSDRCPCARLEPRLLERTEVQARVTGMRSGGHDGARVEPHEPQVHPAGCS